MSSHNEPVKPVAFDAAAPATTAGEDSAAAERGREPQVHPGMPRWVLPILATLVVLAVLVFFWLPTLVDPVAPPGRAGNASSASDAATQGPAASLGQASQGGAEIAPWQEAQQARLRKEAQDALSTLLDVQFALDEMQVESWAPQEYAAARAIAAEADELYRDREFTAATERYREGQAALEAIRASIPDRLRAGLDRASLAIDEGDAVAAIAALDTVDLIEPGNAEATALRARSATLDQVLALLQQAAQAEGGGDLSGAQDALQAAVKLDSAHVRAASELARVGEKLRRSQFNDAMSDGYTALDEGRFSRARDLFRQARNIMPESAEVDTALLEVASAQTAWRLSNARSIGSKAESEERWADALKAYQDALAIDSTLVFAKEGLKRSEVRSRLDQKFRAAIANPERLGDDKVAAAIRELMWTARNMEPMGPLLTAQLTRLEVLLEQASTPVVVTLRSDNSTEVILYKVARLGRFEQRELSLKPGKYTAVGTRKGFRDVRRTFEVLYDATPPPVTISCTESI